MNLTEKEIKEYNELIARDFLGYKKVTKYEDVAEFNTEYENS